MVRVSGRLCRVAGFCLLAATPLAGCEDVVYVMTQDPLVRDVAEDGEYTVYREEF